MPTSSSLVRIREDEELQGGAAAPPAIGGATPTHHQASSICPTPGGVSTCLDTIRDMLIVSDPIAPVWTLDDFEIGRKLGQGQYGDVYLGRERRTGYLVGIKAISKAHLIKQESEHLLRREIEIHSHLIHPNILGFYGWFTTQNYICLLIEIALGELMDLLKDGGLEEARVSKYMLQMIGAIRTCHKLNVIHRDLKPENILLSHDGSLKLADFGWAAHIPEQENENNPLANQEREPSNNAPKNGAFDYLKNRRRTYCGTFDYLSPEIVRHDWYGREVDLWCLGILCYELVCGGPPFPSHSYKAKGFDEKEARSRQQQDIQQCSIESRLTSQMSAELKDFLCKTLNKTPSLRMTTDQMLQHPFITKHNDVKEQLSFNRIFDQTDNRMKTPNIRAQQMRSSQRWEHSRIYMSSRRTSNRPQ